VRLFKRVTGKIIVVVAPVSVWYLEHYCPLPQYAPYSELVPMTCPLVLVFCGVLEITVGKEASFGWEIGTLNTQAD